jgi:hypothetical protein
MLGVATVLVFLVAFGVDSRGGSAQTRGGSPAGDGNFIESHTGDQDRSRIVDKLRREPPGHDGAAGTLFVDPPTVARARSDFVANLRAGGPKRALFERSIDVIGANGVLDGVEQLWPHCHEEAHDLGKVVYARLRDLARSLQVCANRCNAGCMHGVLMEALRQDARGATVPPRTGLPSSLEPRINDLCRRDPEMIARYSPGDCAHGVGHALMWLADYDVPSAIDACKLFVEPALAYYCATGAYMEYVTERDAEDVQLRSLLYPCDTFEYPTACARHKMGYVVQRHYRARRMTAELVQACERLSGILRRGCFHGLGNAHMGLIAVGRTSLSTVCLHGTREDRVVCIEGAIERMARYHEDRALHVCAELADIDRQTCLSAAKNKMYSTTKDLSLYLRP